MIDPQLAGALLGLLVGAAVLLDRLARACGERRSSPRRLVRALTVSLPLVVLAPWLDPARTLLPSSVLAVTLPGLPQELRATALDPYGAQLNDVALQLAPWEREVRRAFGEGRWPFWSDTLDGGSNLWANPQAGVLSPVALAARLLPWRHFLLAGLALKIAIAFSGAVLLARRLGTRAPAAIVAGLAFALGGAIFAWALFPLSTAVAWMPWFGAALVRLVRRPSSAALVATALTGAALLLSGHPEIAFMGALFSAALAWLLRRRGRRGARGLAVGVVGGVLAAGLAAPAWLPFVLVLPSSQRLHERLAQPPASAATWPAAPLRPFLAAALDGHAFGRPYGGGATLWPVTMMPFSGRAAVLLAISGATLARRRRLAATLLALWIGLLLVAPGARAPWLLALPELNRFLPIADLALALAAALGLDALRRATRGSNHRATSRAVLGASALHLASVATLLASCARALGTPRSVAMFWPWLVVAVLAWWAVSVPAATDAATATHSRTRRFAARWIAATPLLAWTGVELLLWNRTLLPRGDARLYFPETPLLREVAALAGAGHRAVGQHYLVPASLLPAYGIGDIRPHNPLAPAALLRGLRAAFRFAPEPQSYFGALEELDHPLLSFLDVRAVVSNSSLRAPATLERVDEPTRAADASRSADLLWRNPRAVGRVFLASGADPVSDPDLERWILQMRDPRRVALAPAELAAEPFAESAATRVDAINIERWQSGDVTLITGGAGARLLASSLPGPLGWRAEDGTGVPLRTVAVNGGYLGVRLPPGVDNVRMRFRPPGLGAGATFAAAALLILVGSAARRSRSTVPRTP